MKSWVLYWYTSSTSYYIFNYWWTHCLLRLQMLLASFKSRCTNKLSLLHLMCEQSRIQSDSGSVTDLSLFDCSSITAQKNFSVTTQHFLFWIFSDKLEVFLAHQRKTSEYLSISVFVFRIRFSTHYNCSETLLLARISIIHRISYPRTCLLVFESKFSCLYGNLIAVWF